MLTRGGCIGLVFLVVACQAHTAEVHGPYAAVAGGELARVGLPAGTAPAHVVSLPGDAAYGGPSLAWARSGWGIVWPERDPSMGSARARLVFARLDAAGREVAGSRHALFAASSVIDRAQPRLFWIGGGYAIAYLQVDAEHGARFRVAIIDEEGGHLRDPGLLDVRSVAWSGEPDVLGALRSSGTAQSPPVFAYLGASGAAGRVVGLDAPDQPHDADTISWNGAGFATAWTEPARGVVVAAADLAGNVDRFVVPDSLAPAMGTVAMYTDGASYVLGWGVGTSTIAGAIHIARVNVRGAGSAQIVSLGRPTLWPTRPSVWIDHAGTALVAWSDWEEDGASIALARLRTGDVEPEVVTVTRPEPGVRYAFPQFVSAAGGGYALVYAALGETAEYRLMTFGQRR